MAIIKIIDSGLEKYSLKSDTNVLGRMYDNNAEAVDIIIPEAEAESVCYANVVSCDGEVIDRIKIENNSLPISSNLTQYCEIYIGFSFIRPDDTEKQSEQLKFGFLYAIKPKDFTPEQPDTEKALAKLIASGFVKLIQDGDTVKFYNWQDIVVGTICHEGINGFEIVDELPTENIDTHTIYLVKETVGEADDYYNEYIYINGEWELLGSTRIDLSDYYTKEQVDKIIETLTGVFNEKVDIINVNIDKKLDKQTAQTTSDQIYGKLADGSQTMFDLTMGAEPTTIPRRDTAGRIQVADGVSGNDAVNFNQLSAVESSVINSLDKEHIAYVNKENTFTEPQTFSYVDSVDPNLSEYGELGGSGANYSYTEYTDDTHKYSTSGEAYISSSVGRVMVGRSTSDEKGVSKNSIVLDVRKNWIARTEINAERVDGKLGTAVQTYYAYKFPKTYPNKEVTLATIEDLTAQLDTKLDKAGGTVTGDMVVGGNFTVQGKTTTVDSENLRVTDKLIEVGKGNAAPLTSPAGLITPKYDGTNNGGIVYDYTGTAYVGDITLDSNGNVDVNNSDLQPIATRNATITNGNLVKWDGTNHKLVDAGKNVENLVDKLAASLKNQAYVRNANGEDTGLAYTYTDEGNTLAFRNASGQLQVSDPSQDKDAANKSYADNLNARYVSTSILGG